MENILSQEYEVLKETMRIRLEKVKTEIHEALVMSGRGEDSLTLIGVSKHFPSENARAAYELGLCDLGENRVQELLSKEDELNNMGIHPNWHMIGTLQTNKVRMIVGHTKLIHSVSSEELILEIQKRSLAKAINTSILLQVNISQEASKHGFSAEEMDKAVELAGQCPNITLCGLMTMAPVQTFEHEARAVFEKTYGLFTRLGNQVREPQFWSDISMGMSQDYIDAIQCGATHIRIGSAIFGQRSY